MRYAYIILALILILLAGSAYAESDMLFIRAGVVQCGTLEELNYACEYDKRCCTLKELFWEEEPEELSDVQDGADFQNLMKTITVEPSAGGQADTVNIAIQ